MAQDQAAMLFFGTSQFNVDLRPGSLQIVTRGKGEEVDRNGLDMGFNETHLMCYN